MKNIQIVQEASFNLYIKDIVLNLNDWVQERTEGEVDDLTIELLLAELVESLCPIHVSLASISEGLFKEKELKKVIEHIDIELSNLDKAINTILFERETFKNFNNYQEAKNKCSDDWLCDFACTFNPCAISYVAYAVGRCSGVFK